MRKILSIDFDIIMAPSINLYNDLTMKGWEFFEQFPQMDSLKIDAVHYQRLTELLMRLFKTIPKDKIHWIEDHGRIVHYIQQDSTPFHLVNIDHHHDTGYHPEEENEPLNCGDWVRFLASQMLSYTWVGNRTSGDTKEQYQHYISNKAILEDFDLNSLLDCTELYLCLSEPWLPPYLRPLFYTWLDLYRNIDSKAQIDYTRCE